MKKNMIQKQKRMRKAPGLLVTVMLLILGFSNRTLAQQAYQRVYASSQTVNGTTALHSSTSAVDAADGKPETFSTIGLLVSFGSVNVYQNLIFSGTIPGTTTRVKIGTGTGLIAAGQTITLQAYNGASTAVGSSVVVPDLVNLLSAGNEVEVPITPGANYDRVRVTFSAAVGALVSIRVYDAYYLQPATGSTACDTVVDDLSGVNTLGVASFTGSVSNPERAYDNDTGTFSVLTIGAVGVAGYTHETFLYNNTSAPGDSVRIFLSNPSSLLSVGALNTGLTIATFNGSTPVDFIINDPSLLSIQILPGNSRAWVSFKTSGSFDRIAVRFGGSLFTAGTFPTLRIHEVNRFISPPAVASQNVYIYAGGSVTLQATPAYTSDGIEWYNAPSGGTLVPGGIVNTTISPAGQTLQYYAAAVRNGCSNRSLRTLVNVHVGGYFYPRNTAADLSNLSQWTSSANGTGGTSPVSFTNNYQTFEINSNIANPSFSGNWVLSGGTNIVVTNSSGITAQPGARLDVGAGSSFNLNSHPLILRSDAVGTASIGEIQGTLSGADNVTVARYIPAKASRKYVFTASSIGGVTVANSWQHQIFIAGHGTGGTSCPNLTKHTNGFDATITNNPSFFTYDDAQPSGSKWQSIPNTNSTALQPGKGYRVMVRGDRTANDSCNQLDGTNQAQNQNVVLRATGLLSQGNVGVTIPANTGVQEGVLFAGNPYPSPVNFDHSAWQTLRSTNGIENSYTIYVPCVTAGTGSGNTYTIYSNGTVTNNPSCSPLGSDANIIVPGQSFFIRTSGSSPVTVSNFFQEQFKVSSLKFGHFKTTSWKNIVRIAMKNTDTSHIDECLVRFHADAQPGYDLNWDATAMSTLSATGISSLKGTHDLAIQTRPENFTNDTVKLDVNAAAGNYLLYFSEHDQFASADIYLWDKYLNTIQNIKTSRHYNYSITTDPQTYGGERFAMIFANNTTSLAGRTTGVSKLMVYPNPATDRINIRVVSDNSTPFDVLVYNVHGQIVKRQVATAIANELSIATADLSTGIYTVEIQDSNGYKGVARFIK